MKLLVLLISPRLKGFRNNLRRARSTKRVKVLGLLFGGGLFWSTLFFFVYRILIYFSSQEIIGDILAKHLLSMILLIFFSMLIFSHIITSFSNLYLSYDLELCHSSPASLPEIFLSRTVYTILDSSWMPLVFGLPVVMAYGIVYQAGVDYYASLLHVSFPMILIAAALGTMIIMLLVRIFPARRARDITVFFTIILIILLYLLFRFLRPERLVNPEAFVSVAQYLGALRAPDSPYLPSSWAAEVLWTKVTGSSMSQTFNYLLLWTTAGALLVIDLWMAELIYFSGFSKAQEAKRRSRSGRLMLEKLVSTLTRPMNSDTSALIAKDVRFFFRDNSQWSQLLLLGALVFVYLYNFSVLPLEKSPIKSIYLQNALSFLNIGLAGFVISALSARFIFPAVSLEGNAFWIIRSSPITAKRFLWSKYAAYLIPMLILAELLIMVTNYLLKVTVFMMVLSSVTIFFLVFGIVSLGIGFGAIYPDFRHENIAKVATGFGGAMYMITSSVFIGLVVALEAGPVYAILSAHFRNEVIAPLHWVWIGGCFFLAVALIIIAIHRPMSAGLAALNNYEG